MIFDIDKSKIIPDTSTVDENKEPDVNENNEIPELKNFETVKIDIQANYNSNKDAEHENFIQN